MLLASIEHPEYNFILYAVSYRVNDVKCVHIVSLVKTVIFVLLLHFWNIPRLQNKSEWYTMPH